MGKFWRDCKGAVTVFVSLLLIPAILITGTGVDLARIYTARSIVQDANQLAANSVLASYDALLQDLYGLFGFMKDSEEIGNMVKSQIELAIKGQEGVGDHVGSGQMLFKLFDGSNLQPGTVSVADGLSFAGRLRSILNSAYLSLSQTNWSANSIPSRHSRRMQKSSRRKWRWMTGLRN